MPTGCRNPAAKNFDPTATVDDYSCIYLFKNQGNCHWFEDFQPDQGVSRSFTLSYSIKGDGWVFFHDYIPDMYFHTRSTINDKLYSAKNSLFYRHHGGDPGKYYTNDKKSFFIDVVFQTDSSLILETVNWMTEFFQQDTDQPTQTLTHITIWNSMQHTGRINLSALQPFKNFTARNVQGVWSLKDFRNILVEKGIPFLQDIFHDYALIPGTINPDMAWYKKELLTDKWFCVRFEFDNVQVADLRLYNTTIQAKKSIR